MPGVEIEFCNRSIDLAWYALAAIPFAIIMIVLLLIKPSKHLHT